VEGFTVNGKQVTLATTDSLQQVFDKIATATSNTVTASYDSSVGQPTSDKITLGSGSPIILGSATDTSNFLQVAQLFNNGTGSISSTSALGSVLLNCKIRAFSVPLFRIVMPQAGRYYPIRRCKSYDLRTETSVICIGSVDKHDRCTLTLVLIGDPVAVDQLRLHIGWDRPAWFGFLRGSEC
jgi:hypothetical protein